MKIGFENNSPINTGVKAAGAGAAVGGLYQLTKSHGKEVTDTFKKAQSASIDRQNAFLECFEKAKSRAKNPCKTVEEFINEKLNRVSDFKKEADMYETHKGFQNALKGAKDQLEADKIIQKHKKYEEFYEYTIKNGTAKTEKQIKGAKSILEKGEPSKVRAARAGVKGVASKVAEKLGALKNTSVKFLKSKNKIEILKENKTAIKNTALKYGKPALIGAVVAGATAVAARAIANAVSKKD